MKKKKTQKNPTPNKTPNPKQTEKPQQPIAPSMLQSGGQIGFVFPNLCFARLWIQMLKALKYSTVDMNAITANLNYFFC